MSGQNPSPDDHEHFLFVTCVCTHIPWASIVQTWLLQTVPCVTLLGHQHATPG